MIRCNKCGKELLMEQIPEVHISEVEMPCGDANCDGVATYRNNPTASTFLTNTGIDQEDVGETSVLMENIQDPGEHHG